MCMFIYMYKKKVKKNIYACLIKLLATTKQFIRRNSFCCLKNQAIFFHREHRDRLDSSPPSIHFHLFFKPPSPFHNKPFIEMRSLEEMEGVNDNASAFMHLNIKANNGKKILFKRNRVIYDRKLNFSTSW